MNPSILTRGIAIVLLGIGSLLLTNPLWIGSVTIYPGTGWEFLPLFHAAFSALGLVAIAAGTLTIRTRKRAPTVHQMLVIAVGTTVAVPLYGQFLIAGSGADWTLVVGTEYRRSFVASLIVAVFLLGCGIRGRRYAPVMVAVAVPVFPFVGVLVEWRSSALLGPIVELHFLLTGGPLLGVSYVGPLLFAVAFLIGFWVGTTEHETPSSHADLEEDEACETVASGGR